MSYAIEMVGTWYGVRIPRWLRAFDVRGDVFAKPVAPWGATLWSSECAEVDLGLRTENDRFGTTPLSCSTYTDARHADDAELARQVKDMVKEARRFRLEYLRAKRLITEHGQGGSCLYMPVAVSMANFGWSIISDTRTCVVRAFQVAS